MEIELLVVPDCPNEREAARVLRRALEDVGLGAVAFTTTVIATEEAALSRGFVGSPAFLINGTDPFAAAAGAQPALACRMYRTERGLAGVPDLSDVRRALVEAGAGSE